MGKPGLGLFAGRRKSTSNTLDDMTTDTAPSPDGYVSAQADSGGFRLLSRSEVEKATERRKTTERDKPTSKFPRFSSFGASANKGRVQSFEEDSPAASKRDSKSSNGTQFSSSRPDYNGQGGSTSTLPSSADTSSDDNLFASGPPPIPQHNSSRSPSLSMNSFRKQLPSLPKSSSRVSYGNGDKNGRHRSMTTSSYASTAIPPKLDADLHFGNSTFEDMFSDVNRTESPPDMSREPAGRSLLSEKRTFQAEHIRINPKLDVEPPLKSWESRGSADNLMSSSRSDSDSPPPPPPPHKYSQYAPVASESPTFPSSSAFRDTDANIVRQSLVNRTSYGDSSPEQHPNSISSSSANSLQTPASSRSSNHTTNTTPKASLVSTVPSYTDDDEEYLFAPVKVEHKPERKPEPEPTPARRTSPLVENKLAAPTSSASRPANGRVLTQTEYLVMQKRAASQPPPEEDSEEEDYEDEEDAIKKREEEEIMRRKQQQMHFAREAMRRTTIVPTISGYTEGGGDGYGMSFPSETSMQADEWEDEDVPLGILAQHGFPSQARNRLPTQPANAMPSYIPDRPASVGAIANGARPEHLPAFARNLPADPHTSFIGGGLVQPSNRESMGFNGFARGPASVASDVVAGGPGMGMHSPMMYQDVGMSQPSLVDQIQMRDMAKPKYMGGSSNKRPQGGPFTGMLGQQMNTSSPTRISQMPMMNGMNGMNPMMAMQQMQQMQQMIAMQQMQLQQLQAMQQPQSQDPRMSMAMQNNGFGSGSGMPHGMGRPMSNHMGPGPGYTPSIAPSERSNIGLSARYRPVAYNSDAHSTGTSMTLQPPDGANPSQPSGTIKGIIKKVPQASADEDEDWSRMAARKSRMNASNKQQNNGLEGLTQGIHI